MLVVLLLMMPKCIRPAYYAQPINALRAVSSMLAIGRHQRTTAASFFCRSPLPAHYSATHRFAMSRAIRRSSQMSSIHLYVSSSSRTSIISQHPPSVSWNTSAVVLIIIILKHQIALVLAL